MLIFSAVPPSIEDGPTEVAATVDTRTMLLCDTLGLPRPEVTWEKNDKIIPISGPGYMMHRTGSLQFSAVQVEDSGMYRCVAKNSAGTVYRDIQLSVQGNFKFPLYSTLVCHFKTKITYDSFCHWFNQRCFVNVSLLFYPFQFLQRSSISVHSI